MLILHIASRNDRKAEIASSQHLNDTDNVGTEDQGSERNDYVWTVDDGYQPNSSLSEVENAIKQLKDNNATVKDGIAAERTKKEKFVVCLHRLIVNI